MNRVEQRLHHFYENKENDYVKLDRKIVAN